MPGCGRVRWVFVAEPSVVGHWLWTLILLERFRRKLKVSDVIIFDVL